MKRFMKILALVSLVTTTAIGCGDGDDGGSPPPALGVQIERMGRAGINTAVVDPFNGNSTTHGVIQDGYNASDDPSGWSQFVPRMASNLAILDSLDTVCGNQLLAGATAAVGRYNALAGVLADDRLYINAASGTCQQYLAVEANAVGIRNSDCGGRTPLHDTIDVSYSVLAAGILAGVGDGIANDADGASSLADFPFFRAPR